MNEREAADTITDLKHLSGLVNRYHTRVLLEDGSGRKWTVTRTIAIGESTDNPGLALKIEPIFDNRLREKYGEE